MQDKNWKKIEKFLSKILEGQKAILDFSIYNDYSYQEYQRLIDSGVELGKEYIKTVIELDKWEPDETKRHSN